MYRKGKLKRVILDRVKKMRRPKHEIWKWKWTTSRRCKLLYVLLEWQYIGVWSPTVYTARLCLVNRTGRSSKDEKEMVRDKSRPTMFLNTPFIFIYIYMLQPSFNSYIPNFAFHIIMPNVKLDVGIPIPFFYEPYLHPCLFTIYN